MEVFQVNSEIWIQDEAPEIQDIVFRGFWLFLVVFHRLSLFFMGSNMSQSTGHYVLTRGLDIVSPKFKESRNQETGIFSRKLEKIICRTRTNLFVLSQISDLLTSSSPPKKKLKIKKKGFAQNTVKTGKTGTTF